MAETTEKAPKAPKKGAPDGAPGKGKGKDKDKGAGGAVDHAPKAAEGTPRLREYYEKTVRAKLQKDFGLPNPHQVPRLEKVVLNIGMGDAGKKDRKSTRLNSSHVEISYAVFCLKKKKKEKAKNYDMVRIGE